jgi:hypothetical protein
MNDKTCFTIEPLNNKTVIFIVGNGPTVTFNDNVTVYTYPRVNYLDLNEKSLKTEQIILKLLKILKIH